MACPDLLITVSCEISITDGLLGLPLRTETVPSCHKAMCTRDTELRLVSLLGQHLYQEAIFLCTVDITTVYNSLRTHFAPQGSMAEQPRA